MLQIAPRAPSLYDFSWNVTTRSLLKSTLLCAHVNQIDRSFGVSDILYAHPFPLSTPPATTHFEYLSPRFDLHPLQIAPRAPSLDDFSWNVTTRSLLKLTLQCVPAGNSENARTVAAHVGAFEVGGRTMCRLF